MFKRITSLLLCFLVLSSCFTVYAITSERQYYSSNLGDWVYSSGSGRSGVYGVDYFISQDSSVCPDSSNGKHSYVKQRYSIQTGTFSGGYGSEFVCELCGHKLVDSFNSEQSSYVFSLPAQTISSDGKLIWHPNLDYFSLNLSDNNNIYYCPHSNQTSSPRNDFSCEFYCNQNKIFVSANSNATSSAYFHWPVVTCSANDVFPISGYYELLYPDCISIEFYSTLANRVVTEYFTIESHSFTGFSGDNFTRYFSSSSTAGFIRYGTVSFDIAYEITPLSGLVNVSNDTTYNTNSRAGSITGDYGVIGDNNEVSVVNNTTIINEAAEEYTNPATGTTLPISGWSYDYGDRAYTLDLGSSNEASVVFGDENVTIEETINNVTETYEIYYVIPEEETQDPTPTPGHTHDYTSSITQQPTCTVPGVRTYTCSTCGNTYTEQIPAPGHNWQVKTSVPTEYDANGELLTEGYTIFRCSVCGEEYRSDSGAPPSSGGSQSNSSSLWSGLGSLLGSIFGGIFNFLVSFLEKVVEALAGLGEIITGLFTSVTDLLSGFSAFLVAVFPFLPEEFTTIITLGLVLLVAAGIIRRFLK